MPFRPAGIQARLQAMGCFELGGEDSVHSACQKFAPGVQPSS